MRFILNFGIFIAIIALFANYAFKDVNKHTDTMACHSIYETLKYNDALVCYENLYKKYKYPVYMYNMALSSFYNKDFVQAKKYADEILVKEKKDEDLRKRAISLLELIANNENSKRAEKEYYIDLIDTVTWSNPKNIKVYIEKESNKSANFEKAFQTWDDALGGVLNFSYVFNPQEADITCAFADEIPYNADFIGVAIMRHYKGEKNPNKKYASNVEIKILRKSPHTGMEYGDNEIYATALHEIGHALGIDIHSPYMDDIMYANTEGQMYKEAYLSNHDVATVRRLYEYLF